MLEGMAHVNGIGGFFFEAEDPALLSAWYRDHLGISPPPQSYDEPVWEQAAGPHGLRSVRSRAGRGLAGRNPRLGPQPPGR